jgi:hypothetical protein
MEPHIVSDCLMTITLSNQDYPSGLARIAASAFEAFALWESDRLVSDSHPFVRLAHLHQLTTLQGKQDPSKPIQGDVIGV